MKQQILAGLILGLCVLAIYYGNESTSKDVYSEWKAKYGLKFDHDEDAFRRLIFNRNVETINKHNADQTQTYKMAINQFTGLTDAQFVATYLGSWPSEEIEGLKDDDIYAIPSNDVDWTTQGRVSRVKNQGSCGSCWAFSATGVMQSWSLQHGRAADLSEQQLVDCSRPQGNQGCNGGWPSSALRYVQSYGITDQNSYPYVARDQACKVQGGNFKIGGQASLSGCTGLSNGIGSRPISVTVDATNWSRYGGGVFNNCGASINHAVLLVGVVGGSWKIKNSWGTGWGQGGFIRLAAGNTCGLCQYAGVIPQ